MGDRFLGAFAKLRKCTVSFVMSVRLSACYSLAPTGRVFMKFDILAFFENLLIKFKFHQYCTRTTDNIREDQ